VEGLLCALTGAPAALLVNNNAASLVLVLATLAAGKEVVVSRGELVEIGGSFRIPSILEAAGAKLREVGATNRVRLSDYESALGPDTALILKVFPSNYRLSGFVSSVEVPSLVELCRRRELPLLVDEGSGLLRPQAPPRPAAPQLQGHSSMRELLSMGSDLVCGSGDKLLGGPQAGILVGEKDLVRRCQRHPLYRALRPDRACVVTMGEILRLHLSDAELPIDRLWASPDQMMPRLLKLQEALGGEIVESDAFVGGGAAPEAAIPGRALALEADDGLTRRLREGDPAVIVFQRTGKMIIDLRTVDPTDDQAFLEAFLGAR
jgi:L-seryl-tRNA(Ser) seleniumtransferase